MPTPSNETQNQSSFQGPAAETEVFESQGVGFAAPDFSISSGDEGTQTNQNQADEDIDDLGGEEAIDDAFYDGFANDYRIAAEEFDSSSSELLAFDLTQSDWSVAAPDHEYGKDIINELLNSIAIVINANENDSEESQDENREDAYRYLELLLMCTELQLSYVKLFKAIQSKKLKPMLQLFIKIFEAYNYADLLTKLEKLHEDTAKLQKMMVDANKMLLKEGSDLMVDVLAIGLEASILTALGISNPILGGVIMLGLLYGTKAAKDCSRESGGSYFYCPSNQDR